MLTLTGTPWSLQCLSRCFVRWWSPNSMLTRSFWCHLASSTDFFQPNFCSTSGDRLRAMYLPRILGSNPVKVDWVLVMGSWHIPDYGFGRKEAEWLLRWICSLGLSVVISLGITPLSPSSSSILLFQPASPSFLGVMGCIPLSKLLCFIGSVQVGNVIHYFQARHIALVAFGVPSCQVYRLLIYLGSACVPTLLSLWYSPKTAGVTLKCSSLFLN
jgi:hypothetical protein